MQTISIKGQLVHHRKLSAKCSFFDLFAKLKDGAQEHRVEVILKIRHDISLEQVKLLRSRLVLGDEIQVDGLLEKLQNAECIFEDKPTGYLVHAKDITVLTAWKDSNPGKTFTPLPSNYSSKSNATKNDKSDLPCKFWINTGRCNKGDSCPMKHDDLSTVKSAKKAWLAERLHNKRLQAHQAEDTNDPHAKQSKHFRAAIFATWLIDTFGFEMLKEGSGVMDIAGGRGGVCFELWHHHKIPTTLIDPRPMKYTKRQHQYLAAHPGETHVVQWLELFEAKFYIGSKKNQDKVDHMKNTSLLLGMHPDEATDVIVDVAIAFGKPFAIVPCCVFAEQFPDRRTTNGEVVKTYNDLVDYLMNKHPNMQSHFLPFDGRNRVIYYMGNDQTKTSENLAN
ncbi:hypothetical protein THRCLA_00686 [Thraustotheca clavata]|uniref:C3H1-type domain-containing protein n=1 Tax=Thraustotheca clavata TaxID=74557 RepID=A0A1W0AAM6_9STRA|nr:hypothetical protein THRCLA_00686 [Thraustotheca clavata]